MNSLEKLAKKNILVKAMRKLAAKPVQESYNVTKDIKKDRGGVFGTLGADAKVGLVKGQTRLKMYPGSRNTSVSGRVSGAGKVSDKVNVSGRASGQIRSGGQPQGSFNLDAIYNRTPSQTYTGSVSGGTGGLSLTGGTTKSYGKRGKVGGTATLNRQGLRVGGSLGGKITKDYSGNVKGSVLMGRSGPKQTRLSFSAGHNKSGLGFDVSRTRNLADPSKNSFSFMPRLTGKFGS
tara:strand:- start:4320 stop:5021 length:702 start_codon:yes stop_codon:yes gene_type:complete